MGRLNILPVCLLQSHVNVFLLELFFVLFSTLCLYQHVLAKLFALVYLYPLDFAIQVGFRNKIYLAFGVFQKSHLVDVENSLQNKIYVNILF